MHLKRAKQQKAQYGHADEVDNWQGDEVSFTFLSYLVF